MKNKAFTLAELLVTLSVIGIIAAIAFPVAMHSMPHDDVLKLKKAHYTLNDAISTLVSSGRYYQIGDLGTKSNGTVLNTTDSSSDIDYFCKTLGDTLVTKSVSCRNTKTETKYVGATVIGANVNNMFATQSLSPTVANWTTSKTNVDTVCASAQADYSAEIVMADGTIFYQPNTLMFGDGVTIGGESYRKFSPSSQEIPTFHDQNNFDVAYKIICLDIDGINSGEAPFGYGVRADGKMMSGKRAEEWLDKEITSGG